MNSLITQAVFKNRIVYLAIILVAGVLEGCATTPKPPPRLQMTQLEIRQLQTREYHSTNVKVVMKAVVAALQDDGFIISNANIELISCS